MDLWHFDRVSAYFSDASQNFPMHKISLVSFWMYLEQIKVTIDSFHIFSAHAPNSLFPRFLPEITREGANFIRLPYITQCNMENN